MDRCRLPWSRHRLPSGRLECRCNIKHQLMMETSYLVMETRANSTPVQVYATCMCLPKRKAKEHGHSQKSLPRLLITSWQRKDVWKTLFQNKPSGTINPVYLPQTTLEQYKESANKTLSITNLAQYFYPATYEEHPMNNYDPDRVLLGNHAMERICINSYTGLGEASSRTHSRTKSWNVAQEGTTVDMHCPSAAA